ncbi:MAG: RNA polymerase factor sigma-54 [Bacteroidales bacterium]|nr:RNA polymerase factor sigma-54 [Candidatus Colicola faecequi]
MAGNLGIGANINIQLQQKLTPEQIQVIKMIEMPNLELETLITKALQENPMLEEGQEEEKEKDIAEENDYSLDDDCDDIYGEREDRDEDPLRNEDFDYDQYVDDDYDIPDYKLQVNNTSPDDDYETMPIAGGKDFHDYLEEQVGERPLTEMQRKIAQYIIGNLDDKGYLTRKPEQMVDDLAFAGVEVTDDEMEKLVDIIRSLDPAGVGAYDLKDCLELQLTRRKKTPATELALTLIRKHMEEVARHHFERLQKRYNLSDQDLKSALQEITSCTGSPSSAFSGDIYEAPRNQVTPDFRVETIDGKLYVSLIDGHLSPIRISPEYQQMLTDLQVQKGPKRDREGIKFLKEKAEAGRQFIDAIRQRNDTLLRTMNAIVQFQYEYFLMGDDCYLKPMILEDIANITKSDPSTISRVSNSKYVQTDFGIIPLKHFFSESLTNVEGEKVSTKEIKKVLMNLVENEDKRHPYTDDQLVKLLRDQGYQVARRTINKYRDQLGIPVTGQRKRLITNEE